MFRFSLLASTRREVVHFLNLAFTLTHSPQNTDMRQKENTHAKKKREAKDRIQLKASKTKDMKETLFIKKTIIEKLPNE